MRAWRISRRVNSPKNNDPDLLSPIGGIKDSIYSGAFPQQCLYFLPEPQGQESLRPIFRSVCRYALASACDASPVWRKVAVNCCHCSSNTEDQFFSEFDIDLVLVWAHFWIGIVFVR